MRSRAAVSAGVVIVVVATPLIGRGWFQGFEHAQHRGLFPSCETCHAGITDPEFPRYAGPETCEVCHDGVVRDSVAWDGPGDSIRTNLRFDHLEHRDTVAAIGDERISCFGCHAGPEDEWMDVRVASAERCLACHDGPADHFGPDTQCDDCHLPLAQAQRLTADDVAGFPRPATHDVPGYGAAGHGVDAVAPGPVSAACATCHARDFCIQCHVNAPETGTIQALGMDPRSLRHTARLEPPADHRGPGYATDHPVSAVATCATCHTREDCWTCHVATPDVAGAMPGAAPGRAPGASITRSPPANHGSDYRSDHGVAASTQTTCAGCHARDDCLDCHRPNAGSGSPGYHPSGFLAEHPVASFARETACADCHNPRAFCTSCHAAAGITGGPGPVRAGYHDGNRAFTLGHGEAARLNLESCVTCHVENDCLTCHSATTGRRFNPHGPGFNAERLRRRAGQMCTVCHRTIPD